MFEAINISSQQSDHFSSPFQARLVDHWLTIKGAKNLPLKREFRPQLFPNFLSQFAMISLGKSVEQHQTRIIGAAVAEVLALSSAKAHILATRNPFLSQSLERMLDAAVALPHPSYYRMTLNHDSRLNAFDFTVIALPFRSKAESASHDIMLLGFDFSGSKEVNMLENLTTPLVVPANRTQLI